MPKKRITIAQVRELPTKQQNEWWASLTAEEADGYLHNWQFLARDEQLPPEDTWTHWLYLAGRGAGKALATATPILTTSGWSTMGALTPSQQVFDERGNPTPILEVHPVQHDRLCYELEFSDGSKITADHDHLWVVSVFRVLTTLTTGDMVKLKHIEMHIETLHDLNPATPKGTNRYIVAIRQTQPTPVRCITVASASKLFLAGKQLIATHNTRTGAETARQKVKDGCNRLGLIAPTASDARDVMVEGEALAITTPIATPSGWKTIETLELGDEIFTVSGKTTLVIAKSPTYHDLDCYSLKAKNADPIVASGNHLWQLVRDKQQKIMKTEDIGYLRNGDRYRYRTPSYAPLQTKHKKLSHPYLFGLSYASEGSLRLSPRVREITAHLDDMGAPYEIKDTFIHFPKHAPRLPYLRGSYEQRVEVVQGMIDARGWVEADGKCLMLARKHSIAEYLRALLITLGVPPSATFTVESGFEITFRPNFLPCRIERYISRVREAVIHTRPITHLTKVDSVPVQCIEVCDKSNMFLAGRSMVPTHNSGILATAWENDYDARGEHMGKPIYEPSKRRLTWANGAIATTYSADEPERLRGPQHDYIWCFVGETEVATSVSTTTQIKALKPNDQVLTRAGLKTVLANSKRKAMVGKVTFSNGATLIGTADHPVYTDGHWTHLSELKEGDTVCAINVLNNSDKHGTCTKAQDITCTTATKTRSITPQRILNSSRTENTQKNTGWRRSFQRLIGKARGLWTALASIVVSYCSAKRRELRGVKNATSDALRSADHKTTASACIAENNSKLTPETSAVSVVSTWQPGGERNVYCLKVADQPEYFASGILVHNCDELCLVANTQISTPTAPTLIQNLKRGDQVLTRKGPRKVSKAWKTGTRPVFKLTTQSCNTLTGTQKHPVMTRTGFKNMIDLTLEDSVLLQHIGYSRIIKLEALPPADVYNIEVEGEHEYFANGILNHNCSWRRPETWDLAMFGLRLGANPQAFISTTPKPRKLIIELLNDPHCSITKGSTYDNRANLAKNFFQTVITKYEGTRLGMQELMGVLLEESEGALWSREILDKTRRKDFNFNTHAVRVVVAVDPAISSNKESDECGIVVCAIDAGGHAYVLADLSGVFTPAEWAKKAVAAYKHFKADRIVAEGNQGGEMVRHTIHTEDMAVPVKIVHASRGKAARAEPVSALFEQDRAHMVGNCSDLEDQLCVWEPLSGIGSPDRLDAMVWGITELTLGKGFCGEGKVVGSY